MRLRRLRKVKGLTLRALSAVSGAPLPSLRQLERDELPNPGFVLGLRLAHHLGVSPQYLASGTSGLADLMASIDERLSTLESSIPNTANETSDCVSVFGVASLAYDDEDRARAVCDTIERYPQHLRDLAYRFGISAVIFPPIELFGQQSAFLRKRAGYIDALDQPPAGVFVVCERTLYLRSISPKTVAHEYAHALDCVLGEGGFLSHAHPAIISAYRRAKAAGSFVTPYAGTAPEEYFAEGLRSMVGANDSQSVWPPVSRDQLHEVDPALSSLLEPLFDPGRFEKSIASATRRSSRASH